MLPVRHLSAVLMLATVAGAQGFHDRAPIHYATARDANAITALNDRLAAGELDLPVAGRQGRLRSVLRALAVPESSQMLVFSKTSLHRAIISPHNPRALYFGPDVYVGYVPGAAVLEIAAGDPALGMVFYSLPQDPARPPRFTRDDSCLSCHGTARTDHEPGLLMRSVFPDASGEPIAAAGETGITLQTPMHERWGGWLVTGTFTGSHRGNAIAQPDERGGWRVTATTTPDLRSFHEWFDPAAYLLPTSDVGALLAFEQQAVIHNLLIRAGLQVRCLLADRPPVGADESDGGSGDLVDRVTESLARQIGAALLLRDEAPLDDHDIVPLPAFANAFADQWPGDASGRRLGQLWLRDRLFTLPLSPMIHAPAFAALPPPLRERVLGRLRRVLTHDRLVGNDPAARQRRVWLHEHLQATVHGY